MVRRVVQGYHSTIFAYGQTGSGKTFTMEGYKYALNEKGVIVPRVGESSSETWGLV
jgi:DNA replication protein DnaC